MVRREGVRETLGVIVEGDAEYYGLPLLRRMRPSMPPMDLINLGGVGATATAAGIARRIAPKVIQLHVGGRAKVVVVIDREDRDQCPPAFAREVYDATLRELAARVARRPEIEVVVADRAFEAWILADAAGLAIRGVLKNGPGFQSFEGSMGRRNHFGKDEVQTLLGREYNERRDGPILFSKIEVEVARRHGPGTRGSRSLHKLLTALGD